MTTKVPAALLRSTILAGVVLALAVAGVVLVLAVAIVASPPAAHAGGGGEEDGTPVPRSVAVPVQRAGRSLLYAGIFVSQHRFGRASLSLYHLRVYLRTAHLAGMAEIGAPPTDPEGDTSPGPVSVIAVFGLEHRIVVRASAMFDGLRARIGLASTLFQALGRRNVMLAKITSLDPEGAGGDFSDGMADTLPIYTAEVIRLKSLLATGHLTPRARLTLTEVLARSKATRAAVNAAYGGGE
jgi:hypothetical protein